MILSGKPDEEGVRPMLVAGYVSRDARVEYTRAKNIPKIQFGVCYARKSFMNVVAIGDGAHTRLAACLEKDDVVVCFGTWSSRKYTTKEGEQKEWSELKVDGRTGCILTPASFMPMPGRQADPPQEQTTAQFSAIPEDDEDSGDLPF